MHPIRATASCVMALACACVINAQPTAAPATAPATATTNRVEFPSVVIDREARQLRIACEALAIDAPLEFFCVSAGGPEHESVLRTAAKPSHVHAGLLMLGLEAGSPVKYVASKNSWTAPYGPPIRVSVEWKDASGKTIRKPAGEMLQSVANAEKKPAPPTWIFAGSSQRDDGTYLADLTGYIVTLVNFEHALIDVPRLISSANETLDWQIAPGGPGRGEAVTMILQLTGEPTPATQPASNNGEAADAGLTPEQARTEREIAALRTEWRTAMKPHEPAVRDAARAHYDFVKRLRERQEKLLAEADELEALIDELDRAFQELSEPQP